MHVWIVFEWPITISIGCSILVQLVGMNNEHIWMYEFLIRLQNHVFVWTYNNWSTISFSNMKKDWALRAWMCGEEIESSPQIARSRSGCLTKWSGLAHSQCFWLWLAFGRQWFVLTLWITSRYANARGWNMMVYPSRTSCIDLDANNKTLLVPKTMLTQTPSTHMGATHGLVLMWSIKFLE